jgi:transposase-like protein
MREDCERTLFRRELIRELRQEDYSVSELSRRYGLSRQTLHRWKRRYEQEGLIGLEPRSRRPHRSPRQAISQEWKEAVFELKRRRRHWGAKKIVAELKRRHPDKIVVSERTVGRLLRAGAMTQPNSADLIAGETTIMSKDLMKPWLSAIPVSFIILVQNPPV